MVRSISFASVIIAPDRLQTAQESLSAISHLGNASAFLNGIRYLASNAFVKWHTMLSASSLECCL